MPALFAIPQAQTVWDGVYSAAQAKRGSDLYAKACASCHGDQLEGQGQAPPLSGPEFVDKWNHQTAGGLYDSMSVTMPADKPGTLSRAENADLIAFIFQSNQFPAGKTDLPSDADSLKKIRIEAKK